MTVANPETAAAVAKPHDDVDRNFALLVYGLLFLSVFSAGLTALLAAVFAYARRRNVGPLVRGHHRFQILIFWIGLTAAVAACSAFLGALITVLVEAWRLASMENWQGWRMLQLDDIVGPVALSFFSAFVLLGLGTALWMVATSFYGAVRLASHRPVRHSAIVAP